MSGSSRFAVAVHVLALLAMDGREPVNSECIADSVNTHPVVIRRIQGTLRQAGLVTAQPGAGGGASLARPPEQITLLDVYRAVDGGSLFALHRQPPNPLCVCGRNIQVVLEEVFGQAGVAVEKVLQGISMAQVVQEIEARSRCALES
jgi:Rrf2 family protein